MSASSSVTFCFLYICLSSMSLFLNVGMERLKLSELNSVGGKVQYEVKIWNRLTALESLD